MMKADKFKLAWVLYFLQLYMLFQFSFASSYGYLLIFMLAFPLFLLNKKFVSYLGTEAQKGAASFIKNTLTVFIISLLIYLSVFRRLFDAHTWRALFDTISRFSFIFVFVYTLAEYLKSAELGFDGFERRKYMFAVYAAPSVIILSAVWLAAYPAVMSPDSIYAWTAAVRGSYDGLHPIIYVLGLKLFSLLTKTPAAAIFAQIIICSATFAYALYRLRSWGANRYLCIALSIALPMLPPNAIFAVTLWKDIPYTMGLIVISIELLRSLKESAYFKSKGNIAFMVSAMIFTMAMRYNAPYVTVFSMIVYIIILLKKRMKKQSIIAGAMVIASLIVFMSSAAIARASLGDKYSDYDTSSSYYALPLQGIMAVYHDRYDSITDEQMEKIRTYLYEDQMKAHFEEFAQNDRWRNFIRTRGIVNMEAAERNKTAVFGLYFEFLFKEPGVVLKSYFNQTSIIWNSRDVSYISGMPWYIYLNNDYETVVKKSKFVWLSDKIETYLNASRKGLRAFFEHPASMMMLILILAYVGIKKKGVKSLVFILPALFNSLGYMATIEGQCTRYTYVNYTVAILLFAYVLLPESENITRDAAVIKQ